MKPTKQILPDLSALDFWASFFSLCCRTALLYGWFCLLSSALKGGRRNERLWLILRLSKNYTKYSGFVQFERKPTRTKPSREWTVKTKELKKLL